MCRMPLLYRKRSFEKSASLRWGLCKRSCSSPPSQCASPPMSRPWQRSPPRRKPSWHRLDSHTCSAVHVPGLEPFRAWDPGPATRLCVLCLGSFLHADPHKHANPTDAVHGVLLCRLLAVWWSAVVSVRQRQRCQRRCEMSARARARLPACHCKVFAGLHCKPHRVFAPHTSDNTVAGIWQVIWFLVACAAHPDRRPEQCGASRPPRSQHAPRK